MKLFKFLLLMVMVGTGSVSAQDETAPYRIVGYYPAWGIYDLDYKVTDIPADRLTHINYAFANISESGECLLGDEWADTQFPYPGDNEAEPVLGNFGQLQVLKEAHPDLKVLISIGGWTWSDHFSDVAASDESRAIFAASCVAFMKQYGFDGLDIDWEYPVGGGEADNSNRPEDKQNFTLLLAELRAQLDAQGEADSTHYLLTIAAPAGTNSYRNYELDKIHAYLDFINLMAYDFAGSWSRVTNFHSALYTAPDNPDGLSGDRAIQDYLAAGIPAEKMVLGVPFYGRGFAGVGSENDGLYQPFTGMVGGGDGFIPFSQIQSMATDRNVHRDEESGAGWLYDADTGVMIAYDDETTLSAKADYVKANGLGGIMFWELTNDSDDHTLLNTLYDALTGENS